MYKPVGTDPSVKPHGKRRQIENAQMRVSQFHINPTIRSLGVAKLCNSRRLILPNSIVREDTCRKLRQRVKKFLRIF